LGAMSKKWLREGGVIELTGGGILSGGNQEGDLGQQEERKGRANIYPVNNGNTQSEPEEVIRRGPMGKS